MSTLLANIKAAAAERGIPYQRLMKIWLKEGLAHDNPDVLPEAVTLRLTEDQLARRRQSGSLDIHLEAPYRSHGATQEQHLHPLRVRSVTGCHWVAGVSQPPVSQIESGNDLYLSTLARYSSEFGGRLEIAAVFPDERVELRFRETSPATDTEPAAQ